ncbi:MAG: Uma2 family endonuclease [Hydrogenophilales bacterium CG_4_9_14_3_um_filter_63_34]|nr:MAG: Uma2 family endonuclease [Hydrogenophilales bacterium CG_4_10_14_3_um_filter_63_21]PJB02817.1 MAG: Uma2 family endonuclease [Hydrogenophilales bacterium CG_4_9_14_3_um_filter_63_34]
MGFALHKDERYTVEEYLTWPEDGTRYELIDGIPYEMNAPGYDHQKVVAALHVELALHQRERLKSGGGEPPCDILESPIDVILSDLTVVQPDLIVVCDPTIVVNGRVRGAPDLVVEVLSPSTAAKDRKHKRRLYEAAGVPQYLLIDPAYRFAELYSLGADGRYPESEVLLAENTLTLRVAPGFSLAFHDLFGWPLQIEARQDIPSYG